jgi:hypothetical protein
MPNARGGEAGGGLAEVDDHCGAYYVAAKAISHESAGEPGPGWVATEEPITVAGCDPVVGSGDECVEQGTDDIGPLRGLEV